MKMQIHKYSSLTLFILAFFLFAGISTAEAAACQNNNWQPTFVHDLDNPDGPWYVTSNGQFIKLRIVDNRDWTPHACDLINQYGVRNRRGYTNCQQYTRIQCGCKRGLSERNSSCANFLAGHKRKRPTLAYLSTNNFNSNGMVPFPSGNKIFDDNGMVPMSQPSYTQCPKRNPGKNTSNKFPKNNSKNYLQCNYFKDGALQYQSPYVNGKKQGSVLIYKSERSHRLADRSMYRNGKRHGVTETWLVNRKTGIHYLMRRSNYANGKQHGKSEQWSINPKTRRVYLSKKLMYTNGKVNGFRCNYYPNNQSKIQWTEYRNSKVTSRCGNNCSDKCRYY